MKKHSPGYLISLLTLYSTPEPITGGFAQELMADGLVGVSEKENSVALTVTAKGLAFIDLLAEVPLPISKWVDPRQL